MEKYIEMLEKIKDSVHIERLLNESPTWIGIALSIAMTILGVGFVLALTTQLLGSRTNSGLVFEGVSIVTSFIGILATSVLFFYDMYTTRQVEHLTTESESEVVSYVSQLSNQEYNELKQQVELHRGSTFEDSDLEAINDLLIEKMLPRRNSIIFFRTGVIVNE